MRTSLKSRSSGKTRRALGSMVTLIVVIWLLIGVAAAWQRNYFESEKAPGCERASTIAVTIVAGPLNYLGLNPKVQECDVPVPQPSK